MTPRHGSPPERGRHYRIRPGVYAVLPLGAQMLLTHQAEPQPELQLPGGGIDPGESLWTALHREVMEETGWRIAPLRKLGVYRRFTYMPEYDLYAEKICHIVLARPVRALGAPTEPGHTAVWSPVDLAPEILASPGDAAFVRDWAGL